MRWLVVLALVACDGGGPHLMVHPLDAPPDSCGYYFGACNPLTQTGCNVGEKCTWALVPDHPPLGYVDCAPEGTVPIGAACSYSETMHVDECGRLVTDTADNCVKGAVCSPVAGDGTGVCKQVCDNAGGNPMRDASHACVVQPGLFSTATSSPAAAGACDPACDPLADNDFDGSGSALSRTGSACGSATIGCYGIPSGGTPPRTQFWCEPELHYTTPLHHRTECTVATGCADATADSSIYVNSCNQGYEPLLRESTAVSTAICVAFCAPLDCYAGNCGSNNANSAGAAPHRCANPDALGAFGSGEECRYMWFDELDGSGNWLHSPYSDSVGICVDHDAYGMPRCQDLPLAGSGSTPGAAELGCVSSQLATPRRLPRRFGSDVRLLRE